MEKEEKPGLTHARLCSFRAARNPWHWLLDDDNTLAPNALHQLRQCLRAHPGLGCLCPRIEPMWEHNPEQWLVILGHTVLSYNTSAWSPPPDGFQEWPPGQNGRRPPGGGMILSRTVAQAFLAFCSQFPALQKLGRTAKALSSGEDAVLYFLVQALHLPTGYDGSIRLYHHISADRMDYRYVQRLLYGSNQSYGRLDIMRFGKSRFPYAVARGWGRLLTVFLRKPSLLLMPKMVLGQAVAAMGSLVGATRAVLDPDCTKLKWNPPDAGVAPRETA